ncbi:MAG: helix-turn-helix domain-containing protein [Colwellia sp.]|nr:helix-turn-helix domain-containing protein [Colwellia sp.]
MTTVITSLDSFNHEISNSFLPMSCSTLSSLKKNEFNGLINSKRLNRFSLTQVSSNPIVAQRSKHNVAQVTDAYYLIKFQLTGSCSTKHYGREATLSPGDFIICSSSEPYQLEFHTNYQQAVFAMPQLALQEMFQTPDDYLGLRMGNEEPTNGMLAQFVYSLSQRMDQLNPEALQSMEANLLDLLITSLKNQKNSHKKIIESSPEQHLQRIKRMINMHIKDFRLGVDFIAQTENISKRYLHMLFKSQNISVSKYIQQLRLEGCYKDLTNTEFNQVSISNVALEWGFGDLSHFNRCFKAQYSHTPRQIRLRGE